MIATESLLLCMAGCAEAFSQYVKVILYVTAIFEATVKWGRDIYCVDIPLLDINIKA